MSVGRRPMDATRHLALSPSRRASIFRSMRVMSLCALKTTPVLQDWAPVNHSMLSADWRTHVKILVVGLLFAGVVAAVGSFSRIGDLDLGTAPLVKAGATTAVSGRLPAIR
jgi:hypothetical protein